MDAQEFRKDFLENVKAEAAATGEGSCAAFVDSMAQYLVEAEVLPDFTPAFYTSTTSKRKIYRVDGYVFDEFDYTMNLIIMTAWKNGRWVRLYLQRIFNA